jgi:dienelactone hydrolase
MTRALAAALLATAFALIAPGNAARADGPEHVRFPSLDLGPAGTPVTIDGYLYRPAAEGRHPAVVFMHGCGGMLTRSGVPQSRERAWAQRFNAEGIAVLAVDSFTARGVHSMCAPANFRAAVFDARPRDAYGALAYLRTLPFIAGDRIALMGWSEGGGATLYTIRFGNATTFRAAVAFYPARCNAHAMGTWTSPVPLLVLIGESDVWTPAAPCLALMHASPGAPVQTHTYPGAYHDFDWPHMRVHSEPGNRTLAGVVPIAGTNEAARADALERVPAFLERYLFPPAEPGSERGTL